MRMISGLRFIYLLSLLFLFSCVSRGPLPSGEYHELRLEVKEAILVASGRVVEVKYRICGDIKTRPLNPKETYIVDELTGEIIFVERPPRLFGGSKQIPFSYIVFPNNKGVIKKGGLITVVIGGLRQEHIRVMEQSIY
ncbi:MAG: hypothetical protein N2257_09555 [Thermodesulfovibrionales bacterium]|nr:hypothetical protein [Thermodesulfovibrionales bacterium]